MDRKDPKPTRSEVIEQWRRFLEGIANERICLSCWAPQLCKYLSEFSDCIKVCNLYWIVCKSDYVCLKWWFWMITTVQWPIRTDYKNLLAISFDCRCELDDWVWQLTDNGAIHCTIRTILDNSKIEPAVITADVLLEMPTLHLKMIRLVMLSCHASIFIEMELPVPGIMGITGGKGFRFTSSFLTFLAPNGACQCVSLACHWALSRQYQRVT